MQTLMLPNTFSVISVGSVVQHVGRYAEIGRHLAQPVGVRTVRGTDDNQNVAMLGQRLDRILAVLRGIADVVLLGPEDGRETAPERIGDGTRIIQ